MYLRKVIYNISFIFLLGLFACSNEYPYETFNISGGENRANSYESYGKLPMLMLTNEKLIINDSSGIIQAPVAFGPQDYIIATCSGKIIRLMDTRGQWEYQLDSSIIALTGIAGITKDEISAFVSSDHHLISLNKDGKLNFKTKLDILDSEYLTYSELLALNDAFVVGTSDGFVGKYEISGKIQKSLQFKNAITKMIASENGILTFGLTHNLFGKSDSLIISDRSLNIKHQIGIDNFRILHGPIIKNGIIYIAGASETEKGRLGRIITFDSNGKLLHDIETDLVIRTISVDNNGNIYAAGFNSGVGEYYSCIYSFDKSGKERWVLYLKSSVNSPIIICKKYITFVGLTTEGPAVFAIRHEDGLLVRLHPLNELPLLYLHPTVSSEPMMVMFGSDRPVIIKMTETQLDKVLPW
jgi:outer membrane protein assembly factor BamB